MSHVPTVHVWATRLSTDGQVYPPLLQEQRSSRVTRVIDDSKRLLFLSVPRATSDDVESLIRQKVAGLISKGLLWNGQRYTFLGFTAKHVKEGTLVLFREDASWTASQLLQALGNLDTACARSGYGRFATRLDLSFAFTTDALDVPNGRVALLDDLYNSSESLYTKDCGIIRDSIAKCICEDVQISPDTSVFHVQRGDWSGTLVRYPDEDFTRLCSAGQRFTGQDRGGDDYWIACRRSVYLHDSSMTMLEILGYSRRSGPSRLTAETILKLLTLGTPPKVFEELLTDDLNAIASLPRNREQALRYVTNEMEASPSVFTSELLSLLLAKHDLQECYVKWMLKLFQHQQYKTLQQNLSIRVEESARLYGVVDEEGILGQDEVFINLPDGEGILSDRPLLIVRYAIPQSASYMWLFKAVRCERLRHLTNCVVFSKRSKHAKLGSVVSGALDKHQYFVTWNTNLVSATRATPNTSRSHMSSHQDAVKSEGSIVDVKAAALDVFMLHKYGRLPEDMMKQWHHYALRSEKLAHNPHAVALQPLIQCALDDLHDPAFTRMLWDRFHAIQAGRSGQYLVAQFTDPLETLRRLIPTCEPPKISSYTLDPVLDIRGHDEHAWDDSYREAANVCWKFNQDLEEAVKRDELATSGK
ncbi:RNA-dependent RNA polymerase [Fomitopsis serialis]|uniref:RNA-dependent RNA polymerase n=1 Tax=Fomitopsis serialis TaxID=139415 RepID=UPI0020086EF6|nr:RNA-dependent RNA polymerase [Neoantrodia serialis]KAH9928855.1 RNA-dependent RNA polymerase [Neoantrodia serialis]